MEVLSQRQIAEDWLKYAIENWQTMLTLRKIGNTGQLFKSFKGAVIDSAGGERLKLEIAYSWYGMMVDMGTGRGVKAHELRERATERRILGKAGTVGPGRRPKAWFRTKGKNGIAYQMFRLNQLMGEQIAKTAVRKDMFGTDQIFTINF